jgi:hypothetical protein
MPDVSDISDHTDDDQRLVQRERTADGIDITEHPATE